MKTSINAWSVKGDTGLEEMFAQISAAGFDGGTVFTVGRGGIKRITHKTRKNDTTHDFYNIEDQFLR